MKRILGSINRKGNGRERSRLSQEPTYPEDSPEGSVVREVTAFCESGGPDSQDVGDEYLHLPAIVDTAESSPSAAREAANCIRRFLSKENGQRAWAQYNALMLMRILTDNPGKTFTVNFDTRYVMTVKDLLRDGQDMSVQQILRETLDYLEGEKLKDNDSLGLLVDMWRKEKSKTGGKSYGNRSVGSRVLNAPPHNQSQQQQQRQQQQQQTYYQRQQPHPSTLPPPDELAARIEEAKTTAKLLLQTIQSTPPSEIINNELINEFAERAQAASRSIQGYIGHKNPPPDEDTMLTLIETSEQLSIATSKHHRAVLQARKVTGISPAATPPAQAGQNNYFPGSNAPNSHPQTNYPTPHGVDTGPKVDIRVQDYAYSHPRPDQTYSQSRPDDIYSPQPAVANRSRPISPQPPSSNAARDYGIAENPFTDEDGPQGSYDRTTRTPSPPRSGGQQWESPRRTPQQNASVPRQSPMYNYPPPEQRSNPYNSPYQSTPSYINRQESATNHLTMHGANSPPPQQAVEEQRMMGTPVSPLLDGPNGINRRMGDMHV